MFVDAGIFIAHFDSDDVWHDAVEDFFNRHVINNAVEPPGLFTTYDVINEYLHRMTENYKARNHISTPSTIRKDYADKIVDLINTKLVDLLDLDATSVHTAIDLWGASEKYGAKDVFHAVCANDWGTNLITTDFRLKNSLVQDRNFHQMTIYVPDFALKR
ncbi:PIN domain-containing protein [Alicyclobacillus sp. SO9]|uniref:PIN domain-containing protein n=1 Tax=Alicyclobacillus sp. SO9 TaxID=2665646 RepID=UPI0018E7319F|nr:PIN domain-containing protein [Alicyclobacillus sp. SO9]